MKNIFKNIFICLNDKGLIVCTTPAKREGKTIKVYANKRIIEKIKKQWRKKNEL